MEWTDRTLQRQRIRSNLSTSNTGGHRNLGTGKPACSSVSMPNIPIQHKSELFVSSSKSTSAIPFGLTKTANQLITSRSASSISLHQPNKSRNRLSVPSFVQNPIKSLQLQQSKLKLPDPNDMIFGALRAGDIHYPRGMKTAEILEVLYSVYENIPRSHAFDTSLKRTLDILVAKGIVSRSFGARPVDATHRLVDSTLPKLDSGFLCPDLCVNGQGIKPAPPSSHLSNGNCLPAGNHFQSRIGRNSPSLLPTKKSFDSSPNLNPKTFSSHSSGNLKNLSMSHISPIEKCKLSKSFAYRVGAVETLKPIDYRPNSPVSVHDSKSLEWDLSNKYMSEDSLVPLNFDWDEHDEYQRLTNDDDDEVSLSQRFRNYSQSVELDIAETKNDIKCDQNVITESTDDLEETAYPFRITYSKFQSLQLLENIEEIGEKSDKRNESYIEECDSDSSIVSGKLMSSYLKVSENLTNDDHSSVKLEEEIGYETIVPWKLGIKAPLYFQKNVEGSAEISGSESNSSDEDWEEVENEEYEETFKF